MGTPWFLNLSVRRLLNVPTACPCIWTWLSCGIWIFTSGEIRRFPEDFRYDFPALVAVTMRDLPETERLVLRTASLFDGFSAELITAAAGLPQDALVLRLVERPFVDQDPDSPWPYHLHDLIREAVREADKTGAGPLVGG